MATAAGCVNSARWSRWRCLSSAPARAGTLFASGRPRTRLSLLSMWSTTAARGCLILDLRMNGMQGLELQRLLTSARWPLPLIVMSADHDASFELEARRQGAKAFLRKPFKARALLDAIAQALALPSS